MVVSQKRPSVIPNVADDGANGDVESTFKKLLAPPPRRKLELSNPSPSSYNAKVTSPDKGSFSNEVMIYCVSNSIA